MTQRRAGTDGQKGGDEEAGLREVAVADRVDAAVDGMEAAGPGPVGDVVPGQPEAPKLAGRDDPVLPAGQLRHGPIRGCSTFLGIIPRKVEHPWRVARAVLRDSQRK